jgi:hypothetical protein
MRTIILICLAFAAGYFTHIYIGRQNVLNTFSQVLTDTKPPNTTKASHDQEIIYENGHFNPSHVDLKTSRYLSVTNRSDALMWLQSDYPDLFTVRGYGKSEQIRIRVDKPGSYKLTNKLNLNATATFTVGK